MPQKSKAEKFSLARSRYWNSSQTIESKHMTTFYFTLLFTFGNDNDKGLFSFFFLGTGSDI